MIWAGVLSTETEHPLRRIWNLSTQKTCYGIISPDVRRSSPTGGSDSIVPLHLHGVAEKVAGAQQHRTIEPQLSRGRERFGQINSIIFYFTGRVL